MAPWDLFCFRKLQFTRVHNNLLLKSMVMLINLGTWPVRFYTKAAISLSMELQYDQATTNMLTFVDIADIR